MNRLRGYIFGEFQKRQLINSVLGKGASELIVLVAKIIQKALLISGVVDQLRQFEGFTHISIVMGFF